MADHSEAATRGDGRILLTQGARRGVARIGERRLPLLHQGGIECCEVLEAEEHLATHLEQARNRVLVRGGKALRDVVDRQSVERDQLARTTVTAGCGTNEFAVLVDEIEGDTIDFHFTEIVQFRPGFLLYLGDPCSELRLVEDVVEAEHPLEVVDGREVRRESATDELRRRVGSSQIRVLLFESIELPEQCVECTVRNDGRITNVVAELMLAYLFGQLRPLLARLVGRWLHCIRGFSHS